MKLIALHKQQAFSGEGIPLCDNFHFSCIPKELEPAEKPIFEMMGYTVREVTDTEFADLCEGFAQMVNFQLRVSTILDNPPGRDG